jgi:predicted transcriptional regulator YheO
MNEGKKEIIEKLKHKGINPIKLEKDLIAILRKGTSMVEVSNYLKKVIEGEKYE